ncbi:hypothetical protein GCK32_015325 [Trichostrongylus colubriformis]|uniref:Uncharacterized protein n=1 Tax=Trichostrongylus colubriformis TaxID=6319 RepID=A0AAN8IQC3_TRICO
MTRLPHTTEESDTTVEYAGTEVDREHPYRFQIGVVNLTGANVRIRCQSILSDKRDVFMAPNHQLRFRFAELKSGCDCYAPIGNHVMIGSGDQRSA